MFKELIGTKADINSAEYERKSFFKWADEQLLEKATSSDGEGEDWYNKKVAELEEECNRPQLAKSWLKLGWHGPALSDFLRKGKIFQKESYWDIKAVEEKVEEEKRRESNIEKFGLDPQKAEDLIHLSYSKYYNEIQDPDSKSPNYFGCRDALLAVDELRNERNPLNKLVDLLEEWIGRVDIFHSQLRDIEKKGIEGSPEAHEMIVKRFRYTGKGSYSLKGNSDMCFDSSTSYEYHAIQYKEFIWASYEEAVAFTEEYLQAGKKAMEELLHEEA